MRRNIRLPQNISDMLCGSAICMVTGWAQIDGQWRYFNPVSDGKRGIMLTDSWIDGWYVNPDGIWDGQAQAQ